LNCGNGKHKKAKLLGVWETLTVAHHLSLTKLQILGDSKVVIDCLNKKGELHVCTIEGWKTKVHGLLKLFHDISLQHIYKTHNIEAEILSRKSYMEPKGRITYYSWENSIEGQREYMSLS